MNNSCLFGHEDRIQWRNSTGGNLNAEKYRLMITVKKKKYKFQFYIEYETMIYCLSFQIDTALLSIKL